MAAYLAQGIQDGALPDQKLSRFCAGSSLEGVTQVLSKQQVREVLQHGLQKLHGIVGGAVPFKVLSASLDPAVRG